jgi:hypothetical protein
MNTYSQAGLKKNSKVCLYILYNPFILKGKTKRDIKVFGGRFGHGGANPTLSVPNPRKAEGFNRWV